MHLLPCPSCQQDNPVSPSQAGDEIRCKGCDASIPIPRLGDLRKLPRAEQESARAKAQGPSSDVGIASRFLMSGLGVIGVVALLITVFCVVQWFLHRPYADSEQHIAEFIEHVDKNTPAVLVLEYESMEQGGLDLSTPFKYKMVANTQKEWGISALAGGIVTLLSILGCVFLATSGRTKTSIPQDTVQA